MMLQYYSNHSNEVHQLTIALSQHFYVTKEGYVRWQKRPFHIHFGNYEQTGKTHIVNYVIRDHYSGMFFGAVASTATIRSAQDFLLEAWSLKEDYPFGGIPECLVASKSSTEMFPGIAKFLQEHSVKLIEATSGFQAGVRDVRTFEEGMGMPIGLGENATDAAPPHFKVFATRSLRVCQFACDSRTSKGSKVPKYLAGRSQCRYTTR